ncbi:gamma-glutamylcyclotransferase [Metabacillus sp. B2-18]|uniref:gamma-glutamylcyclotransferase n=1 Tax=Metabacillus sp. B2-18 TaxID=2897333 RepID=UPI001E4F62EE|nr:gamma-glutamylcyclotransferase family protein [Metabacillus sp. B2-18]UGB28932.1 gamma-glutamylcyclotransferase [Metabacillus sp. B2-18]
MKNTYKVFVYGTLREHESNHHFLNGAVCLAKQCWTHGILFDTGLGYPAMITDKVKVIYGELYEINEMILKKLDWLEGFEAEGVDNEYERITQTIFTDHHSEQAIVYSYLHKKVENLPIINCGDWKRHLHTNTSKLLYFAYGSCMDNERFKLGKVDHLFKNIVGCGHATNFSLAYTVHFQDGSRADMIEADDIVEGKVYEINQEALHYLYEREGVMANIYRPAFINVEINGVLHKNVLTFLVVNKKEEAAPPEHYSNEILRGAKGFVSSGYYRKLENKLLTLKQE